MQNRLTKFYFRNYFIILLNEANDKKSYLNTRNIQCVNKVYVPDQYQKINLLINYCKNCNTLSGKERKHFTSELISIAETAGETAHVPPASTCLQTGEFARVIAQMHPTFRTGPSYFIGRKKFSTYVQVLNVSVIISFLRVSFGLHRTVSE